MTNLPSFEDTLSSLEETLGEDTSPTTVAVDPLSPTEQRAVDQQSTLLGVDPVEVSQARVANDFSHEDLARQYPDSAVYLETLRVSGISVEEAAEKFQAYQTRLQESVGSREFFFNSMLMTDDEELTLRVFVCCLTTSG